MGCRVKVSGMYRLWQSMHTRRVVCCTFVKTRATICIDFSLHHVPNAAAVCCLMHGSMHLGCRLRAEMAQETAMLRELMQHQGGELATLHVVAAQSKAANNELAEVSEIEPLVHAVSASPAIAVHSVYCHDFMHAAMLCVMLIMLRLNMCDHHHVRCISVLSGHADFRMFAYAC